MAHVAPLTAASCRRVRRLAYFEVHSAFLLRRRPTGTRRPAGLAEFTVKNLLTCGGARQTTVDDSYDSYSLVQGRLENEGSYDTNHRTVVRTPFSNTIFTLSGGTTDTLSHNNTTERNIDSLKNKQKTRKHAHTHRQTDRNGT